MPRISSHFSPRFDDRSNIGGFSPLSLSPVAWYKADSYVGNDGDAVATWADSSGHGYGATEGTNKPLYKTNIINGKPAMLFTATLLSRLVATFSQNPPFTIYAVTKWTDLPIVQESVFDGKGDLECFLFVNGVTLDMYVNNGTQIGPVNIADLRVLLIHKVIVTSNGVSSSLTINNLTPVVGNMSQTALTGLTIGKRGGTATYTNAYIPEVILFNGVLPTGDQASVYNYLSSKYAI